MRKALMSLAATMMTMDGVLAPSNRPILPLPPAIRDTTDRQKRKAVERRLEAAKVNQANFAFRFHKRQQLDEANAAFYAKVNALTNWQRNAWAKYGYPGLRGKDASLVPLGTNLANHPIQVA